MAHDPERQKRVREALHAASLDALVCASPSEVLLLSGYWPVIGISVAVFTADGDCTVILPEDEVDLAMSSSVARLAPYSPSSLTKLTTREDQLRAVLGKLLDTDGLMNATIGVASSLQMQPSSYASSAQFNSSLSTMLRELAPQAHLQNCSTMISELKSVKTPTEVSAIARSAEIASAGFRALEKFIQPGLSENEVAAHAHCSFESSSPTDGSQRSYGYFFCMSGPNSAKASAAFARTQSRRLEQGDLMLVHANTCLDGYWTDITRTYTVGGESGRQKEIREAIHEARNAAINLIRPGAAAREVDHAARQVMQRAGMGEAFRHSTGHGVGFAAVDGNALPRIHPVSPDTLAEGMLFNVEPAAYFDGYGGMRHCDMVAVTKNGVQCLTDYA